jgi:hypothetical protein
VKINNALVSFSLKGIVEIAVTQEPGVKRFLVVEVRHDTQEVFIEHFKYRLVANKHFRQRVEEELSLGLE